MRYIADRDGERRREIYCPEWPRLLADIGGTNARFALEVRPGQFEHVNVYPCSEFPGICDAIQAYLSNVGAVQLRHAAVAIANPVHGDLVAMTNNDWRFSIDATRRRLGFETLCVVNDFTALAMALPYLDETQLRQTGGESARHEGIVGLLGAGTGLGVSGLVPTGNS